MPKKWLLMLPIGILKTVAKPLAGGSKTDSQSNDNPLNKDGEKKGGGKKADKSVE